jgi:ATP-dependent DNA helicase HFM1/MER3
VDDRDAVAARHALDLARSLSAGFWETSNLQLRQISGIGPAALRKLVNNDITSVEKLTGKDTASIERILTKNPPFGRKLLDSLVGFPCLSLASEITGRAPNRQGQNPRVNVRAVIKYLNARIPVWMGKKPSLTLIAGTTDGSLVHFWRGSITKLEKGDFEVKFTVKLSAPGEEIRCWVACDSIVGTARSCLLKNDIPASAFPRPSPPKDISKEDEYSSSVNLRNKTLDSPDEFGGDELDDDDFLAAVKTAEKAEIGYESDGFADIDDFDNVPATQPTNRKKRESKVSNSVQMASGKWTCNHPCRGDQLLKNGQQCKHKCCRDGLDKPAKPRKKVGPTTSIPEHSVTNKASSHVT